MDLSRSRFSEWLAQPLLDTDLKEELLEMADSPQKIEDAFGCELQFGTGGLRGILGAGTNRMNIHVVRRAAQATADVLNAAGIKGGVELGKVVAGGAMMGPAVENLSYPTTKTTSGLIMLSEATAQPPQVNPCIRCGRCVEYCPMGLEPVEVNQAYAARDVQELGKLHVDYCFNCGSCTFVCPAKRPCTQMMGLAKAFYLGEIKKGGNK